MTIQLADHEASLVAYLIGTASEVSSLKILTGGGLRTWAGVDVPEGYNPEEGAALLLKSRGGNASRVEAMNAPSFSFRCIGEIMSDDPENAQSSARAVEIALYEALHYRGAIAGGAIRQSYSEGSGELIRNAQGWYEVITFYTVWLSNSFV